jgi:rRNA maturation protein Nop10
MKRSSLLTALYLLLVFVSGAVVGGFGHRLYTMNTVSASVASVSAPKKKSPEELRRKYVAELQTRLGLANDQLVKLNGILDTTHARFTEERDRSKAGLKAIHDDQVSQVRSILGDSQRVEYDKWRAEREKHRREMQKPHPDQASKPGPGW